MLNNVAPHRHSGSVIPLLAHTSAFAWLVVVETLSLNLQEDGVFLRQLRMILLPKAGGLVRAMLENGAPVPMMLAMRGEEGVRRRTTSTGMRLPPRQSADSTITPRRQQSQRGRAIRSPRRRQQQQQQQPHKQPLPFLRLLLRRSRASQHTSAHPQALQ